MKLLILFLITSLTATHAHAVTRPDIDTVSILGLAPGLDGKMVGSHINEKLDTLLWSEDAGVGIVKFVGNYFGQKGEFRIAYDKGLVSQVSFVVPTHNQEETKKIYDQISQDILGAFGTPDLETTNNIHEMRWEGMKQSISVKAVDETQYVTIALSKFSQN